ncbi:MAG: methyltransferase domain-containing protein [Alphaproteobacteria bacterium]|nr:methyltransferase domain-containing protein [Alphaproteobacteria bacterium]
MSAHDSLIFDRPLARARRARAGRLAGADRAIHAHVARELALRLGDVERSFSRVLALGAAFCDVPLPHRSRNPELLVRAESVPALLAGLQGPRVAFDEEALPFAEESFDVVLAPLVLHGLNDLPGALVQLRRALRPDGLLLAALFGGETLRELREALLEAEIETMGGASPRVAPMASLTDCAGLLQRAGVALPVADRESLTLTYESPLGLFRDLRAMGETSTLLARTKGPLPRAALARMLDIYTARYPSPGGRVRATFEIFYLTAWAPDPSQPKPLRPGSATARLADALGTTERPAGDKARP